jgi:hypothetical protein
MSTPIDQIKQYTACFDAGEVNDNLNEILDAAMSSEVAGSWESEQRSNLIFFFRQTQKTLGAVYKVAPSIIEFHNF